MKALLVVCALTATGVASSTINVPDWVYLLGAAIPALLGGRWYARKIEKRLLAAQARTEEATTSLTEAKTDEIKEQLRLSVLESVRDDMARQREETARALAAEKEAIAEVALLIAQHARDRSEWKDAKHSYENTILAQSGEITLLRGEVESLREEVHTLRVALGVEQGRRHDDDDRQAGGPSGASR